MLMPKNVSFPQEYLRRRIDLRGSYDDLLAFPRYFELETVNACNARCPMCTIEDWQRDSPTMKEPLFRKIADEIIAHAGEVKRVSLYRDGEPLLDKKMASRIAYLKQGGINEVTLSTNVSLLNEKRATDILEAGLDSIILSIDSLKKDVFEAIRVRLNFEEVLENALRFIELRNKIRPSCSIRVRMVRQETNADEWPEYERFWRPKLKFNDRVNYHNIHNWGGQLKEFAPVTTTREPNLPCVALWSLMVIFSEGQVPLCNVDYNNTMPTGSVALQSIQEIWQGREMRERRDLHLKGAKADISLCANCNVWDEPSDTEQVSAEYADAVTLTPTAEPVPLATAS